MSKSLISEDKECWVCHTTLNLHRHHIFYGRDNRTQSELQGCWCYLCGTHHNLSKRGVHFNKELDMRLKQECQRRWESNKGTREDFIRLFGRSYLEE